MSSSKVIWVFVAHWTDLTVLGASHQPVLWLEQDRRFQPQSQTETYVGPEGQPSGFQGDNGLG
jgi:hypothetical protein